jgi:hypothetical protein
LILLPGLSVVSETCSLAEPDAGLGTDGPVDASGGEALGDVLLLLGFLGLDEVAHRA